MFTWISKPAHRVAFGLITLLSLTACEGAGFGLGAPRGDSRIAVAGGEVVVAGPRGYCVDKSATRDAADSAFVLMASCASVTQSERAPTPRVAGVLVASVAAPDGGAPVTESMEAFGAFFNSDAGRAALSQTGQAETVEVLETSTAEGVFFVHARDSSDGLAEDVRDEYWRALFDVKGRLVSASVFGTEAQPFSTDAGRALLAQFVAQIRAANAGNT